MFETLEAQAADAILGLSIAFRNDNNPSKVDLGVGVYKTEDGETPVMRAVKAAESVRLQSETSKSYIGPAGSPAANTALQQLLFDAEHSALKDNRVRSVQTPGGCGALRVAAELIVRANPNATIWVSNPTWVNHIPLLGSAGLTIAEYPYYDYDSHSLQFDAMLTALEQVKAGDLVLLHGCCHNPCGADLSRQQWQAVAALAKKNGFTPFIDMAYQGFGESLDADAYGLRLLAEELPEVIVASSCSKNFGLYRERAGMLAIVGATPDQADATLSNIANVVRGNYSMPPAHGSAIVETILGDDKLNQDWQSELAEMRERIQELRVQLVQKLVDKDCTRDFSFIARECGMFSFLGLSKEQVRALIDNYSIYMVDSSRINVAGLSSHNLDYVADAITEVLNA
jgi:aspartate aminotransferase